MARWISNPTWIVIAFTLVAGLAWALPSTGVAGGGNSANAKLCQKGGWQTLQRADGTPFASEKECVSYGATGGTIEPIPTSTPTPTPTPLPTETPVPTPTQPEAHIFVVPAESDPTSCQVEVYATNFPPLGVLAFIVYIRPFPAQPGDEWEEFAFKDGLDADENGGGQYVFTTVTFTTSSSLSAWAVHDEVGEEIEVKAPEEPLLVC